MFIAISQMSEFKKYVYHKVTNRQRNFCRIFINYKTNIQKHTKNK